MTQSWRTKTKAHAREKRKNEKIKKLYTQRMYERTKNLEMIKKQEEQGHKKYQSR